MSVQDLVGTPVTNVEANRERVYGLKPEVWGRVGPDPPGITPGRPSPWAAGPRAGSILFSPGCKQPLRDN